MTTPTALPFHPTLFTPENIARLTSEHAVSEPYQHGLINKLFDPDFLKEARQEIVDQIAFKDKETDIYKIAQTGDLTNLSGLPAAELALLPTLLRLRDSLYSETFRTFIQKVTGCGALSGIKTDMSCNEYSEGSYLLNHDDVIGTRRISFILYLVLDEPKWEPEWGGALELYPVLPADPDNPTRPNVPAAKPTVSIPPAFNQFAFFKVQPGHSFHSVEEVVVEGDGEKGGVGARVSLSGWFHKPVEGEEGYDGGAEYEMKSSLQQLYETTLSPSTPYPETPAFPLPLPLKPLSAESAILKTLLNPAYLSPSTLAKLRTQFVETSQLVLSSFLAPHIATELETLIRAADAKAEAGRKTIIGGRVTNKVSPQDTGEDPAHGWSIVGPPHIQRFLSFTPPADPSPSSDRLSVLLAQISALLTSPAFRTLLASLTSLLPTAHTCHVRRFRPGVDYTLARGETEDGEARLDVGLGLTPRGRKKADRELWEGGEVGGWELWLAGEEGGDEATYG
ncbi:prolyl 3-hydroxylase /prolyl 3,4-dihydroxylase, partial [Phenoliferia sp. Uapishka_3]